MAAYIQDDEAYQNAIRKRIAANSRKTNMGVWDKIADHGEIVAFLENHKNNKFMGKLYEHYNDYGKLSDGQADCVRRAIIKEKELKAERAINSKSAHIGVAGERREFELTIKFHTNFETNFGTMFVYIFEDNDGNVLVYKGKCLDFLKDDKVKGKASIKEHGERDGIKQTVIARTKFEKI